MLPIETYGDYLALCKQASGPFSFRAPGLMKTLTDQTAYYLPLAARWEFVPSMFFFEIALAKLSPMPKF